MSSERDRRSHQVGDDEDSDDTAEVKCGLGMWRPSWIQRWATPRGFLFFMCLLTLAESMMIVGYTSSVIVTIERRFQLKSTEAGLIVSGYEIGNLLVVAFVSFYGGRPGSSRPKWVGCGAIFMAFSAFIFTLPHLIGGEYKLPGVENSTTAEPLCGSANVSSSSGTHSGGMIDPNNADKDGYYGCLGDNTDSELIIVFLLAQMLLGMSAAPLFTLGITYLDDNVSKDNAAIYIAIVYCMTAVGPALGFILGGICVSVYVDFGRVDTSDLPIDIDDPQWVGAWWLGYLICGTLMILTALPILAFPKSLQGQQSKDDDVSTADDNDVVNMQFNCTGLSDLKDALVSLLTNPTYICICMVACLEISIVTGFLYFIPKFLGSQFGVNNTEASYLTGALIPAAAISTALGGYIIKRFNLNLEKTAKFTFFVTTCAFLLFALLFVFHCDTLKVAGVSVPYIDSVSYNDNYTAQCNADCYCSESYYKPVCGSDNVTYFSACYAGCNTTDVGGNGDDSDTFSDCRCIPGPSIADSGTCENDCQLLPVFMVFLILVVGVTTLGQIPGIMVTLRSVEQKARPFALGIQFVFLRALAYIPSPIYYGKTVDKSCMLWQPLCEGVGACLEYDNVKFHFSYLGLSAGLKCISVVFSFLAWQSIKRGWNRNVYKEASLENGSVQNSGSTDGSVELPDRNSKDEAIAQSVDK
ncbi:solute carrier organic anion transporter family member 5A1-like [Antedon mediterranea]|uniref:solute carrier organic anion transporter family member 5A1-like n=1 Tax=Antedon mediterranea TaxID=105859 RepID=UPI003AF81DF9